MLTLFRDGFARDMVVLLMASILVGTVLSVGIARAVDTYFGDTINGLLGDYGEYDLILHIREDAKDAALKELRSLVADKLPGTKLKESLTIVGKFNVFVSIPEELKTKQTMESLRDVFSDIPGQTGFTLMTEPTVAVRLTNSSLRERLTEKIEAIEGVRFVFRDGSTLYALLESVDYSKPVTEEINRILEQYQIIEVNFPIGQGVDDVTSTGAVMIAALEEKFQPKLIENITLSDDSANLESFLITLSEMKSFLESYATKVTIPLEGMVSLSVGDRVAVPIEGDSLPVGSSVGSDSVVVEITDIAGREAKGLIVTGDISDLGTAIEKTGYEITADSTVGSAVGKVHFANERYQLVQAIDESVRLLSELDKLSGTADETVSNAQATLETFQKSLVQLDELQKQIEALNTALNKGPGAGAGNAVLSMLITQVMQSLVKGENVDEGESVSALQDLDVEAMQENLANLAGQLDSIETVDVQLIIDQIEQVKNSLPQLRDDEIGQSIQLIDSYIQGQVIPGEKIQLLVDTESLTAAAALPVLQEAVGNKSLSCYASPIAIVNPNARAELVRVLREVKATIAGMLAVVFTVLFLILDYSTVLSTMKCLLSRTRRRRWAARILDPVKLTGGLLGLVLFVTIYVASGAEIPYVNVVHVALIGVFLGTLAGVLCEKFSPVDISEVMAGEALGLTYVQIMRNIVIPSSRPGLMNILNRWKQVF